MELELYRPILEKYSNIKFHENLSSGNGVVPWRQRDVPKLMVAFSNFANAPKNDDDDDDEEDDDDDDDDDEDDVSSNNLCPELNDL
jgi:hypothetical protein